MAPITIKYRQNTDTIPTQYRYSTYPCLCFLLHVHSISSSRRTPACVRVCQCIVVCLHSWRLHHPGPIPASHAQHMPQIHFRRRIKCSKSLHAHWLSCSNLSGPLSLALSLSLSLSFFLSLYLSLSLSLYFDLLSRSWSRSWWLLLTLTLGVLSESRKYMLVSVWFCLLPSATDESTSQGRVMCEHY